jgi:hypothetical protein
MDNGRPEAAGTRSRGAGLLRECGDMRLLAQATRMMRATFSSAGVNALDDLPA